MLIMNKIYCAADKNRILDDKRKLTFHFKLKGLFS